MSFSIAGKTAIVTGAANGVGLAIGRHFVKMGANVVFADMDEKGLCHELADEAGKDENVRKFAGDLRKKLTIRNLLSATVDAFERVDILVNASRQVITTDPLDPDDNSVEELLQQNTLTAMRMSQAVARRMIKQAGDNPSGSIGSIVNISSIAACRAHPDLLAYSVSTAALEQMTRSMAVALAANGIRVNAVAFGSVMSASLKGSLKDQDETREAILENTPLHRIASPGEVSDAVQYLASDASNFVTGQIITVDGGRTLIDPAAVSAH
ncbi:SDR family NAD(P)-dependent oxidoreductase [Yoonia sediminilitoris]|uniref:7-alpha-hydroxysteroid dehydrogenase n=1 Tax=Yoonia sediminilitoris TaxID=1286148 RepID=A0A2T6K7K0_9RHOB|nr:SDR family oxidoreductase [Yoonia sediminilitoris]PUB10676.1 7-alpha-hydroxysteroid dehydrogenase [Yoonia sediminilitoris]RCW90428.1 7-alpha-hydroxysteroid dehydrogenase [Yoonia sediminilitoris]